MANLKDIADKTGFSIRTVARAINNDPNVKDETREKVNAIAQALQYRPHFAARSLKLRKTDIIGVLRYRTHVDPDNRRIAAISEQLSEKGFSILQGIYNNDETRSKLIDHFRDICDALIISSCNHEESVDDFIKMKNAHYPFVLLDPFPEIKGDFPSVRIDRAEGITEAVEALYKSGKKNIAFLNTNTKGSSRLQGFKKGLLNCNLKFSEKNVVRVEELINFYSNGKSLVDEYERTMEAGYRLALSHPGLGENTNALLCYNDALAIGCLRGLYERGLRVPEDVAVVGFDNVIYTGYTHVPLSTVAQPIEEPAKATVDILLSQLKGGSVQSKSFRTEFIQRKSS